MGGGLFLDFFQDNNHPSRVKINNILHGGKHD